MCVLKDNRIIIRTWLSVWLIMTYCLCSLGVPQEYLWWQKNTAHDFILNVSMFLFNSFFSISNCCGIFNTIFIKLLPTFEKNFQDFQLTGFSLKGTIHSATSIFKHTHPPRACMCVVLCVGVVGVGGCSYFYYIFCIKTILV